MKKQKLPAFEIALSGVSCAVATIFLALGITNPYLMASGYVLGCFAMMLPLSQGFWAGGLLSYAATVGLTFLFGATAAPWRLMPFILVFGLHPVVNFLQVKFRLNTVVCLVIKALWFDGALYLIWRFLFGMQTTFAWVDQYIFIVIFVGGTLFFAVYDRLIFDCQRVVNRLVYRIRKR